ncbi:hypothetical protein [Mycoplasma tauri]|uniref:Uncharacterized protein n=1 Tax=Mycoplasma tauri TaxID=547987 RepID=A0A953NGQ5_9MOLU|nr:hypothetical protein [Mycoplasma tauri]MBZ4195371.1 hypothetical protein [Mycoplasma tauri]MBZ4203902.1 hypothetical protein [Mycoplasma tauri]MBZ4204518.1 hypothetical protein [Mycoplasma tauri]MBZ4212499.1 hypothetical protein [Mycoplasma tauri]MBZ4218257.1 hypothetical protein [Mycoplasma tauri]
MATIDRDPEICKAKIEKRKLLLEKMHQENIEFLNNPALIREEDIPIDKKCSEPFCKLNNEEISLEDKKRNIIIRTMAIAATVLLLVTTLLIGTLIGSL